MELKAQEYKTTLGNIKKLKKIEIPFVCFEYRVDGELIAVGTKEEIANELNVTPKDLTYRIYNSRKGRVKIKHELILIERMKI